MLKRYFCILIFSISTDLIADTKINIASRDDFNAIYAIDMIKLALQKAEYPYVLDIERGIHSNDRLEKDLSEGLIDIFWSATNAKLEQQLIPIRVPLYKGLLGHRILVIHNDNKNLFSNVVGLNELRKFNFGQGRDWSDTEILKANGLKVTTGTYEGLFMMTDGKRFDAFPRGILEPWAELATKKDLNITVDENLLLLYKMPYYLFVSPQKPELAKALERGLLLAVADGSFDNYFYNDPTIKKALSAAKISSRTIIELENPSLPPLTPTKNVSLWLDIAQIKLNKLYSSRN